MWTPRMFGCNLESEASEPHNSQLSEARTNRSINIGKVHVLKYFIKTNIKSCKIGGVVAHVIIVSAQVLLLLTLGLWTLGLRTRA